jgi:hypothetical protein
VRVYCNYVGLLYLCTYIVFVWAYCICVGILYFMGISCLCKYFVMCGYIVLV